MDFLLVIKLKLATALVALATALVPNFGAFNFVSSGTYTLSGGGVASSDTSITVDNFVKPVSELQYTMSADFGSIGYLTLEPGSATNKEFVSFSGFSYSGNRATFTGVVRGLEFNSPYTASSTLRRPHAGGTKVIVSNPPQLYNQLATKQNNENIYGVWTFSSTSLPKLDHNPSATTWTASASTTYVTKGYVDDVNNTGASNATESTAGVVELATQTETGSSTPTGSTGANLAVQARYATSSPSAVCGVCVVTTDVDGKINQPFLNLADSYTWTNVHIFSATSTLNSGLDVDADSDSPIVLNTLSYVFPSTRGASSTILKEDGSGNLRWYRSDWAVLVSTTTTGTLSTTTVPNIPAASDLRIVIETGAVAGNTTLHLQFNGDTAGNYAWSKNTQANSATNGAGQPNIRLTQFIASGFSFSGQIDVSNTLNKVKLVRSFITEANGSTEADGDMTYGSWNNTSAQISSVSIGCGTACPAGTRITIYGSNF